MEKRRPLADVVTSDDPVQDFVYGRREPKRGDEVTSQRETKARMHARMQPSASGPLALVNLSVRITPETAAALRHAMLQQKTEGRTPSSTQGIVEEALRDWLHTRGFLKPSS